MILVFVYKHVTQTFLTIVCILIIHCVPYTVRFIYVKKNSSTFVASLLTTILFQCLCCVLEQRGVPFAYKIRVSVCVCVCVCVCVSVCVCVCVGVVMNSLTIKGCDIAGKRTKHVNKKEVAPPEWICPGQLFTVTRHKS